jgi:hypothetical protein
METVARLVKIFEYDLPSHYLLKDLKFVIDDNVPKQHLHNQGSGEEGSACGPFVWALVREILQYIVECREDEERTRVSIPVELALPEDINLICGWDSGNMRKDLRDLIDRETGKIGWKSMLEQGGIRDDWFWDPYMLTSKFRNGDVVV